MDELLKFLAMLNGDWKITELRVFNGTTTVDLDVGGFTMRSRLTAGGKTLITFAEELAEKSSFSGVSLISANEKNNSITEHWSDSEDDSSTLQSNKIDYSETGFIARYEIDNSILESSYIFKSTSAYEFSLFKTGATGAKILLKQFRSERI